MSPTLPSPIQSAPGSPFPPGHGFGVDMQLKDNVFFSSGVDSKPPSPIAYRPPSPPDSPDPETFCDRSSSPTGSAGNTRSSRLPIFRVMSMEEYRWIQSIFLYPPTDLEFKETLEWSEIDIGRKLSFCIGARKWNLCWVGLLLSWRRQRFSTVQFCALLTSIVTSPCFVSLTFCTEPYQTGLRATINLDKFVY